MIPGDMIAGDDKDADNQKVIEHLVVHELAHGLMQGYLLDEYIKSIGYWIDKRQRSFKEGAEAPITTYGNRDAGEDFAEAVRFYFVQPETLKNGIGKPKGKVGNPCPIRYAFIDKAVKSWKVKKH